MRHESAAAHASAPWPYQLLDPAALRAGGWRPTPLHDVVLKVHQRCNLACDYCYVYQMADQSWRRRPRVITPPVWRMAAHRIAEHASQHDLAAVRVILHGGEPLLAGTDLLLALLADIRAALPHGCRADFCLQTNGVLLDRATLSTLHDQGVQVGVSLDGVRADNDRHRRHADGRGSYDTVVRALRLLGEPRFRSSFGGVLSTIDLGADPVTCYEGLLRYEPPAIDFLLPHANWSLPPRVPVGGGATPYGDWLVSVFDRWYSAPVPETGVRLFEDVISLVLGGASRSEQIGLSPVAVVVIETDGTVEQVDSLKSAYPGAAATGLTVFANTLDDALAHPGVAARQIGAAALCERCLACPLHEICGGGHYVHRYRAGSGFRNPSVYCADLIRMIEHIRARVAADLASAAAGHR